LGGGGRRGEEGQGQHGHRRKNLFHMNLLG
jgi:hypothetical protein